MTPRRLLVLLAVTLLALVGCDGGDGSDGGGGGGGDDGDALGASAETTLLARATVDSLPAEPLVWSAFPVAGVEHRHDPSFVHARQETTLTVEGDEQALAEGQAAFVPAGTTHRHGNGTAWDTLLTAPGAGPPDGVDTGAVFTSDELEGLPGEVANLLAIRVDLPPGSQTSVHTHPGPEFIYVTGGPFVYENGIIGEDEVSEGDHHTLPAGEPVQKRNPADSDRAGSFLSWFIVDPDRPFAPGASFDNEESGVGEPLAPRSASS